VSWPEVRRLAMGRSGEGAAQEALFGSDE
jgi:hypothetical protein